MVNPRALRAVLGTINHALLTIEAIARDASLALWFPRNGAMTTRVRGSVIPRRSAGAGPGQALILASGECALDRLLTARLGAAINHPRIGIQAPWQPGGVARFEADSSCARAMAGRSVP